MAQRALQRRMGSGQGETSRGVVKRRTRPIGRAMTALAGCRQAQGNVVDRRLRVVVIRLVARHACRAGQVVVVADVAQCARSRGMFSGQGETCDRVVECRWLPGHRGVAVLTSLRQVQRNVVQRSQCPLIIRQMACHASYTGELRVIELRSRPAIDVVANRAIRRKLGGDVIRRLRLLKLLSMAGVAIRRETFELPGRSSFMTGIAIHHGVRAYQWKTILVILNRLDIGVPALDRVTGLAIRAHLSAMNVRMAIGALRSYIGKDRLGMALRAGHIRMHAAQRVFRFVVIEFGDRADGLPSSLRVAVLAGNGEGTVRAPRAVARRAPPRRGRSSHHGRQP